MRSLTGAAGNADQTLDELAFGHVSDRALRRVTASADLSRAGRHSSTSFREAYWIYDRALAIVQQHGRRIVDVKRK
jgi:hypothetical protein